MWDQLPGSGNRPGATRFGKSLKLAAASLKSWSIRAAARGFSIAM